MIKKKGEDMPPTFLLLPHFSPSPPVKSPVTPRWNLAESNTLANITADQFTADHSLRLAMNLLTKLTGESRRAGWQAGWQAGEKESRGASRGVRRADRQAGKIGRWEEACS